MKNIQRGTPGMLLLLWAGLLPVVVLFAWRVHAHRAEFDWSEYPTALGDAQYYTTLGANDYYEPNLHFGKLKEGLYRRSKEPLVLLDEGMLKAGKEKGGRCFVYRQSPDQEAEEKVGRYFLKSADDRYVEFGARLHWPDYQPPTTTPAP